MLGSKVSRGKSSTPKATISPSVVNAILQTKGEEAGWKYLEELNENIDYYSKRDKDPNVKTMAGEVAIGITYIDKGLEKMQEEKNVTIVYPEDGIPYVPEGVAVFKQMPLTTKTASAALSQINMNLEEAGRDLGAGKFHVINEYTIEIDESIIKIKVPSGEMIYNPGEQVGLEFQYKVYF